MQECLASAKADDLVKKGAPKFSQAMAPVGTNSLCVMLACASGVRVLPAPAVPVLLLLLLP